MKANLNLQGLLLNEEELQRSQALRITFVETVFALSITLIFLGGTIFDLILANLTR